MELARLQRHLDPHADVRQFYETALARSPEHPGALRGLVTCLSEDDREGKLAFVLTASEARVSVEHGVLVAIFPGRGDEAAT